MSGFLTRAGHRRLEQLADKIGLVAEADAAFFRRFLERRHRMRLASPAEIETDAILRGDPDTSIASSVRWVTIVRQVVPGIRIRVLKRSIGGGNNDFDTDEGTARRAYDEVIVPGSYAYKREREIAAAYASLASKEEPQ